VIRVQEIVEYTTGPQLTGHQTPELAGASLPRKTGISRRRDGGAHRTWRLEQLLSTQYLEPGFLRNITYGLSNMQEISSNHADVTASAPGRSWRQHRTGIIQKLWGFTGNLPSSAPAPQSI